MSGMPKTALLLLALLLVGLPLSSAAAARPEAALKDSEHKKAGKLIAECIDAYVARKGRRDAEVELRELIEGKKWTRAAGDRSPLALTEDLGRALYYSRNYSKAKGVKKGKVNTFEVPVGFYGPDYMTQYELWAPSKYNQKNGPYPVIFCLPGGGGTPAEHLEKRWGSSDVRDAAILVSIHLPAKEANWGSLGERNKPEEAGGIGILLSVFRDVQERYALDHDRVYIVGEGGGVAAAMEIAGAFPDRFAGVGGIAGDAAEISPQNFSNLPVMLAGGGGKASAFEAAAKDAGIDTVRLEPEAKEGDFWAWMQANPRRANPAEVTLLAGTPFPNKAYWVEVPPRGEGPEALLEAKADRATNTVTVEAQGISQVTLFFNDVLLDLDAPVTVVLNGVKRSDLIPRNFNSMMDQIYKSRSDPGKIYTAFKAYDIPEAGSEKETIEGH